MTNRMNCPYIEFEHTADIGMNIYGATLEELFCNAAYALFDTIVDIARVQPIQERELSIVGDDDELLLMNWLRGLLYLCAVEGEVYREFDIRSLETGKLNAVIRGEPLDKQRHDFKTELKAVTYHQFQLSQEADGWTATVIFDV